MNKPALWITADAERETDARGQPTGAASGPRHGTDERMVREIVAARRAREAIMGSDLFGDPAWDLLLELYAASLAQHRLSTTELSIASTVPATTSLRWIDKLESVGLAKRIDDPLDSRRVWIEITADGKARMCAWIQAIRGRVGCE